MSAAEFLQALLGDDPSLKPLTDLLIARTEGNPFFLEESVRTLVETGVLVGEREAHRLGQALPTIQVPATVQAVLAARIDRLPAEEKRLLQTTAVIGTEVPWPLLHAIADVPEAVLQRHLTALQSAEFLYETRLFPESEYTFKHTLTHEVAYSSLLLERRRVFHARIVEALEVLAGALDDPRRLAQVALFLSNHFYLMGLYDQAMGAAQRALVLATASGEVVLQAQANYYLGVAYMAQGNYRRAIDRLRQTVVSLDGARRHERFGWALLPAVASHNRPWR